MPLSGGEHPARPRRQRGQPSAHFPRAGVSAPASAAEAGRNLCRNLIILDRARIPVASRRHVGRGIANDVEAGIQAALAKVATFASKWSEATLENVIERYGIDDVATVFRALVENRIVHAAGVGSDDMVERLQRAWDFEPGYSKTAIVNAITRAAHTEEWRSWTTSEDLERTAGELLYARSGTFSCRTACRRRHHLRPGVARAALGRLLLVIELGY